MKEHKKIELGDPDLTENEQFEIQAFEWIKSGTITSDHFGPLGSEKLVALSFDKDSKEPIKRRPPRSLLKSLARFVFPSKVFVRVFETTLADIQLDYVEARSKRQRYRAFRIRLIGTLTFWWTAAHFLLSCSIGKLIRSAFSFRVDE